MFASTRRFTDLCCIAALWAFSAPSQAINWSLSGNAGIATDYLDRGVSFLDDGQTAQIFGGLDLSLPHGLFVGTWISNANPNTEVDIYAGWAFSQGDWFGDAYVAGYLYPQAAETPATLTPWNMLPPSDGNLPKPVFGLTPNSTPNSWS